MKKHDYEQMLRFYDQWQASSESKKDFAIRHSIRPSTFYYWTKKFERADLSEGQAEAVSVSGFHRISMEGASGMHQHRGELMAAIHYPSGTRLELYSSFQHLSNSYAQLLKTLTE